MQNTQTLYHADSMQTRFCAVVTAVRQCDDQWQVTLDKTAFYPEGGGQPADHGTLNEIAVTDVQMQQGEIWHTVESPIPQGTAVQGEVDWQRRLDLMQQHTGEHILSGLLHSMFSTENVGFHIGQEFVTMDINAPLTWQQLMQAEWTANSIIWKDVAVDCKIVPPDQLDTLQYRSKKAIEGDVRIVTIPGADCCACCGTHLPSTGMVGQIKILDAQRYKGGTRLTVVCGGRALKDYNIKRDQLAKIGAAVSMPHNRAADGVDTLQQQIAQLKMQLADARNLWFDALCASVSADQSPLIVADGLDGEAMRSLCLRLCECTPNRCAVLCPKEGGYSYAVGQKDGKLTEFVRSMNSALSGKGGGKPFLCMGSLQADINSIKQFWNERKDDTTQ